ncbi:alpha/beta hydrolase family protein [Paludisphaera sp.]|uniref:dienelactone hydrolase family protein n=1 Tax=Paludisphaera sp. TaxID=2017432 RepID=UPI00301CD4DD
MRIASFTRRAGLGMIGLSFIIALFERPSPGQTATPRPVEAFTAEDLGRKPLNDYGSLEGPIRAMRAHRPLDLNAEAWRKANPGGDYKEWAEQARECLRLGLNYDLPPVDLKAATLAREETDDFVRETIEFNTTPWFRVPGYFYTPKNVPLPAPALLVLHEWGGPMLFGADRVSGEPAHPAIARHREEYSGGRALADWYASKGYAVIVIDAYHFGRRAPRGLGGLPAGYDPARLDEATLAKYDDLARQSLFLGVRELNWAGVTWAGVNFGDDSRCVDYLLSREEVDPARIGCTGLSGGGWRTNMIAALEPRVKAVVSVGWMTTGDTQQAYNVGGAIGTFNLLPGVWNRLDVPDLIAMAAPRACMVVGGTEDILFPPLGQREAARQIAEAFDWAGSPDLFRHHAPAKPHCYDRDIQEEALAWFDRHLKAAKD